MLKRDLEDLLEKKIDVTTDVLSILKLLSAAAGGVIMELLDSIPSPTINTSTLPSQIGAGGVFTVNVTGCPNGQAMQCIWINADGTPDTTAVDTAGVSGLTGNWNTSATAPTTPGQYYLEIGFPTTVGTITAPHRRHRIPITVGPALTVSAISGIATGGSGAYFSVTASGGTLLTGSTYSYTWSASNAAGPVAVTPGFPNAANTNTQTFPAPGQYNISVTVTDSGGASQTVMLNNFVVN